MKICLLGIKDSYYDEGMKSYGMHLARELQTVARNVIHIDVSSIAMPGVIYRINKFDPDIIHLIPGPTAKGLFLLKILGSLLEAKTVASALHPAVHPLARSITPFFSVNLMLVQSKKTAITYTEYAQDIALVPSGVDLERFNPVSDELRTDIRDELGFYEGESLFLHVGHFKRGRNLHSLTNLTNYGTVLIIGSTSTKHNSKLIKELVNAGCILVHEYVEDIERYYQAADVYVFPTEESLHSIQIPLSILEAMACNRPVLTTTFGGLPDFFDEGAGLRFVDDFTQITQKDIQFEKEDVSTRSKVRGMSWNSVAGMVYREYRTL